MRARVQRIVSEIAGTAAGTHRAAGESLKAFADRHLQVLGFTPQDIQTIEAALSSRGKASAAAAGIGAGFGGWMLAQTSPSLEKIGDHGISIALFIRDNVEVLTAGWDEALPAVAGKLVQLQLEFPDEVIELGGAVAHLVSHAEQLSLAAHLVLEHGESVGHALDMVGVLGDVADVADIATTLGASLVLSWAAGKWVDRRYAPQIKQRADRLAALELKRRKLLEVRYALKLGIPNAVIAGRLGSLPRQDWDL